MSDLVTPGEGLREQQERARVLLTAAYTDDIIDAEELDRRMEAIERAASGAEVMAAVPGAEPGALAVAPEGRGFGEISGTLSNVERKGRWTPARHTRVRAVLASMEIDLREANLPPGVIEFEVMAVLSSVEFIVPPGVRVNLSCSTVLSNVEDQEEYADVDSVSSIRIEGRAYLGTIEVKRRLPGEGWNEARKRRKADRRRLKEARKRRALPSADE